MRRDHFDPRPCRCGCGRTCGWFTFKPGHDARAMAQVIQAHYAGSARAFVESHGGEVPEGANPWPRALKVAKAVYGSIEKAVMAHVSPVAA